MIKNISPTRQRRYSYLLVTMEFMIAVAIALFFIASLLGDFTSIPNILSYSILLLLSVPLCIILYFFSYDRGVRTISLGLLGGVLLNIVSGAIWYILPLWKDEPLFPMIGMFVMVLAYVPMIAALYRTTRLWTEEAGRGFLFLYVVFTGTALLAIVAFAAAFALSGAHFEGLYRSVIFILALLADLMILSLCSFNVFSPRRGEVRLLFAAILVFIAFSLVGDFSNLLGSLGFFEAWNISQIFYSMSFISQAICLLVFSMQAVNTHGISRVNKELFDARRMMEDFVMQTPDAVCMINEDGAIVMANDGFLQVFGLGRRDLAEKIRLFDGPGLLGQEIYANLADVRDDQQLRSFTVRRGSDKSVWLKVRIFPTCASDGSVSGYAVIAEDVTEKENAIEDLKKSRAVYRAVVEDQTELICRFREDGTITFANEAFRKYFAAAGAAAPDDNFFRYFGEEGQVEVGQIVALLGLDAPATVQETTVLTAGGRRWMQWTLRAIFSQAGRFIEFQSVGRDITDRKDAEDALKRSKDLLEQRVRERTAELAEAIEALRREIREHEEDEERIRVSLKEKEVLLKEIHHRVKNNLQIISSLLSLQAGQVKERESIEALMESQGRIRSIALIHEKLYQSEGLAKIDFYSYVEKLIHNLRATYAPVASQVRVVIDVDNLMLDIDHAIPCGLIINELVTNAFKYAFKGDGGEIYVGLHRDGHGLNRLEVRDNGPGLPAGLDIGKIESLGLQLVCVLVGQIDGDFAIDAGPGARFSITFATA